jgi:hypothetical protein
MQIKPSSSNKNIPKGRIVGIEVVEEE